MNQSFAKLSSNRQSEFTELKYDGNEYLSVNNTYMHVILYLV
jgi:hypothetical protein